MTYINPTTVTSGAAAAAAVDPIFDIFGAPDTAFEFDTSSLTGLTALSSTPDVADADTTVPGHYYISDNAAAYALCGHYAATPGLPWTMIAKLAGGNARNNYNGMGVFVGVATPGAGATFQWGPGASHREINAGAFSNPTTPGAGIFNYLSGFITPLWFALIAQSNTDVEMYFSWDGLVWFILADGVNIGGTIGSVGLCLSAQSAAGCAAAFDFMRIWNSAKTFPGTP